MKTRIKVIINGKICTGRAGQTLLEIAQNNGIEIPNLCHNGELKHYGGCSPVSYTHLTLPTILLV